MVKVEGNSIYAGNQVNETLVKATNQLLECFDEVEVSFDVMGRTCHQMLANQLYREIDQDKYGADITYNYGCTFKKKEVKANEERT